jgi:hypothetical protein
MKKFLFVAAILTAVLFCNLRLVTAQNKTQAPNYEYAVVKWDGPDRLFYNLPDKFEMAHISKAGATIPGDAQNEEWCLAYAANKMATDGWEPINLDSRRILFRRAK